MKSIRRGQALLDLPEGWAFVDKENSVGIFRESDGRGAVNVSTIIRPASTNADLPEVLSFFSQGAASPIVSDALPSGSHGVYGECSREGKSWSYWIVEHVDQLVLISYNCATADIDPNEVDDVHKIVRSIRHA
jgi:hypothetical protein